MLSDTPRAIVEPNEPVEALPLEAPEKLVERYIELSRARRQIEEQLAFLRSELELVAAATLRDDAPRGRFVAPSGVVAARLMPTCSFDRVAVTRELQRGGKLADVASVSGPQLARFLAREPVWSARLGNLVRHRHSIMLMTGA